MKSDFISKRLPLTVINQPPFIPLTEEISRLEKKLSMFNPNLEREDATAIPLFWYYDPDIYNAEQAVLRQNWVGVGRTGEAAAHRSYFTLKVAEEPIAVWRDQDTIRAFLNSCRHRATQLLPNGKMLPDDTVKCPYHGWTYDLKGQLRRAPELGKVNGFSRDGYSLIPFEVDTWGPIVFVRMEPGKEVLSNVLAPMMQQTVDKELSSLKWAERREYEIACNWKVYVDNFLDGGYHIPQIHPELAKALNYPQYRTEVFEYCSLQHSPVKNAEDPIASVRQGSDAMYWCVFPNVMANIYHGAMDTNIVIPTAIDRCKVIFDFYFSDKRDKSFIQTYIDGSHKVQLQDMSVCEDVQQGLKSRFGKPGPYAKREEGVLHFHRLLALQMKEFCENLK